MRSFLNRIFGRSGEAILNSKTGYSSFTAEYDDYGNREKESYFGIADEPVLNKQTRCASVRYKVDDHGNRIEESCYGGDGQPTANKVDGVFRTRSMWDDFGNALEEAYFVPVITRVEAIQVEFRIPRWEVETDRGVRSFEISSMRSDVRQLGNGRILIRDADGNRYEIPDRHKLDAASRALVDAQL